MPEVPAHGGWSGDVRIAGCAGEQSSGTAGDRYGMHAACCGPNMWLTMKRSNTVLINNLPAHRLLDEDMHCGGMGFMVEASQDVLVGDGTESGMSQAKKNGKALSQICGGR